MRVLSAPWRMAMPPEAAPLPALTLSLTLSPRDVEELQQAGVDPEQYVRLVIPILDVQIEDPGPGGNFQVVRFASQMAGKFFKVSSILDSSGQSIDKPVTGIMRAILVIDAEALSDEAKAQMFAKLSMDLQAMSGNKPS